VGGAAAAAARQLEVVRGGVRTAGEGGEGQLEGAGPTALEDLYEQVVYRIKLCSTPLYRV